MLYRIFVIALLAVGLQLKSYSSPDTTQIATHLDSAFRLMKKVDPKAVPFLTELLKASRELAFKRGEAEALFCLGEYYSLHEEDAKSWLYFDSARVNFETINKKGRWAQSLNMLGSLKMRANKFAESIPYFEKAASINKSMGRKQQLGDCYYNLASVNSNLGDYVKAIEYYLEVLKLDEEVGFKEGIADDYGNLGLMYAKIGDFQKSIANHKKSIEVSEASGNKQTMSASYTHYGLLLKNRGQFKEARVMLQRSLDICRELKGPRQIATALHNMAALNYAERNYPEAIRLYNESSSYAIESLVVVNNEGLAQVYLKLNRYSDATEFAKRALRIANESKIMDGRKRLNLLLADIASAQGNYKLSLDYYRQYTAVNDSLLDSEKTRQIQDMQAKYDVEKKEGEINALTQQRELQESNIRQKTVIQYALIIGVATLVIFGLITFRIFRGRQEARRQLLTEQLKNEHFETERMKDLDRFKSRFFANIAHEFRTPLTLILGPVENLIDQSTQPAEKEQLLLVRNNTSRLVKLVNQLLDLSKLEAGAIKFDYVQEDIMPFLKSMTFAFQSLADQKKIAISFTTNSEIVVTRFDRDKLEKIFSNLLSNAFKFTPDGGQVSMDVSIRGKQIQVQVTDSGPGIADDDLPYIFNRFYQSETSSRSTTGSGIGLQLTKELVEICGGNISVVNIPSGGAQFVVALPLTTETISSDTPRHLQYTFTPSSSGLENTSVLSGNGDTAPTDSDRDLVLVIEDNSEVRDFIVQSLAAQYHVITATDGGEGIEKARDVVPDLIITDVMMPVKDGLEVCRILKSAQETSHIPVIMLTAKADVESRIEGLETGADDYLAKPFHTKELHARIQNLIAQRKKLQEKFSALKQEVHAQADDLPLRERNFLIQLDETILRHLSEESYSMEMLSKDMAMSRMQLHRKVKALTNTSANLYMRSIRLVQGKRMLQEGSYNVAEVAYRVGFNSATYFSTCFSEEFGFPPSEVHKVG